MPRTLSFSDFDYLSFESLSKVFNPPILYKYVDFEIGLYDILMKKSLKFSMPTDFRDPFDCSEKLINIDYSNVNLMEINDRAKDLISPDQLELVLRQVQLPGGSDLVLAEKKRQYRISCFAKNPLDILMWSHYGQKHEGMCIGFQFKLINKEFNLYPVLYQDEIFSIDGNVPMAKVFLYWLTVKSTCWQYEEEIRGISLSGKEIISYEPEMIREVVFGCKVPDKMIQIIIPVISDFFKPYPIVFRKLTPSRNSFSLVSEILNCNDVKS